MDANDTRHGTFANENGQIEARGSTQDSYGIILVVVVVVEFAAASHQDRRTPAVQINGKLGPQTNHSVCQLFQS